MSLLPAGKRSNAESTEKAPPFTAEEITCLVDQYATHSKVLQGTFIGPAGALRKKKLWDDILKAVNAVGNNNRKLASIRTKLKNMKQQTKSKAASNKTSLRKTGGGSDEEDALDSIEGKMLSTMSSRQIYGIPGGIDVHAGPSHLSHLLKRRDAAKRK